MFLESFDTIKQKVSYKDESGDLSLKVASSRASHCSHTIHNSQFKFSGKMETFQPDEGHTTQNIWWMHGYTQHRKGRMFYKM